MPDGRFCPVDVFRDGTYRRCVTDGAAYVRAPRKLAVLTPGRSPRDDVVLSMLRREFAEFEVEPVTVGALVGTDNRALSFRVRNRAVAYREFGPLAFRRRRQITDYLPWTSYYFDAVRHAVAKRLSSENYAFTFQTESLFDASVAGLPHFIYTSHAALASLDYPGFDRRDVLPRSWIELETKIYRHAAIIFTWSAHTSTVLVERYGCSPEKVVCVYSGGNVPGLPAAPGPDETRYASKRILFVGLRWMTKGGPQLVEAFRRVLEVHPDASLTIVGCSPDVDVPNCHVAGVVPLSKLARYYEEAAIFCLPTIREAFGSVLVEALSYGLPVVATNFGAIPELVIDAETGYLVHHGDVDALAERLIALLDVPALGRRLGANGYALANERYNWESTGAHIRQHVERALREFRGRR
jgi:glycosyltransferase involved in cell wall biosynthesis